jgi:hypothetical protein
MMIWSVLHGDMQGNRDSCHTTKMLYNKKAKFLVG